MFVVSSLRVGVWTKDAAGTQHIFELKKKKRGNKVLLIL